MIVLDFSGTLSLAATEYGRETMLLEKLKEAGLWELGIDSAQRFWDELANPIWEVGSTTAQGYRALMGDRLCRFSGGREGCPGEAQIRASAAAFVDDYFNHSTIDPAWQPVLRWLAVQPQGIVLIATDHYAEATGHVMGQLHALGVESIPAEWPRQAGQVLVANSADLGCWKAGQSFWQVIKRAQGIENLAIVGVVDDFGFNEPTGDGYTDPAKIARRQMQMTEALADAFSAQVRVLPFFLDTGKPANRIERADAYQKLIDRAASFARTVMAVGA
ncbi:MAG: hypothetical protein ACOYYS_26095 [Chloroflexota bacterium]